MAGALWWFWWASQGTPPPFVPTPLPTPPGYDIAWPGLGAMTGIDWPGLSVPIDWPGIRP